MQFRSRSLRTAYEELARCSILNIRYLNLEVAANDEEVKIAQSPVSQMARLFKLFIDLNQHTMALETLVRNECTSTSLTQPSTAIFNESTHSFSEMLAITVPIPW